MWIAIPVVLLVILAIVGGVLVGGIYAAVLLPVVLLILIGAGLAIFKRSIDPEFRARHDERAKRPLGGDTGPDLLPGGRTVVEPEQLVADDDHDEQLDGRQRAYRERQADH